MPLHFTGSKLSGLKFTPRFYHVEVYLNNSYIGIYLLTDQVQVNESRVNITESSEADTGYLMYWDSRAAEEFGAQRDVTYIDSIGPTPVEFKSPDRLSPSQRAFIGDYLKMHMMLLDYQIRHLVILKPTLILIQQLII